tara:strand:+ start:88 stop:567 length:480 start_codon:yes stop_codon:yes gene_type:complete
MQNIILMFIHLIAAAVALGSIFFGILIIRPTIKKKEDKLLVEDSLDLKLMDLLAPTVLTCVFVLIVSGIYYLLVNYTDQVDLKEGYYNIFGMKMLFVIATLALSVYQTFGLRSKVSDLDIRPEKKKEVPEVLISMANTGNMVLWTLIISIFFGVYLARY